MIFGTLGALGANILAVSGNQTLDGLFPEAEFEHDAGSLTGYTTGDNWPDNLGNTEYDLLASTDSTDTYLPELVGEGPGAYFLMSGTSVNGEGFSYFRTSATGASLTTFIKGLNRSDGGDFTLGFGCDLDSTHLTALFSTTGASNTTSGVFIDVNPNAPHQTRVVAEKLTGTSVYNTTTTLNLASASFFDQDSFLVITGENQGSSYLFNSYVNGVFRDTATATIANTNTTDDPEGPLRFWRDNDNQKNNPNDGSGVWYDCGISKALNADEVSTLTQYVRDKTGRTLA